MSCRRFATQEVLARIFDGNRDVEEEVSGSEDLSETKDNAIVDPDLSSNNVSGVISSDISGVPPHESSLT